MYATQLGYKHTAAALLLNYSRLLHQPPQRPLMDCCDRQASVGIAISTMVSCFQLRVTYCLKPSNFVEVVMIRA
jgi:hypothetical protein